MKRYKLIIATLITGLLTIQLRAQSSVTVKGGLLLSNVTVSGVSEAFTPDKAFLPGWQIGVFTELPMSSVLSFTPGLQIAEKGFMAKEGFNINVFQVPVELGVTAETRLKYIQAPLWLTYSIGEGPVTGYLTGGPTIGYAVNGEVKTKANFILDFNVGRFDLDLGKNLYNRFEIGMGLGGGLEFDTGKGSIMLEANYQHSFTDILADPLVDIKVRNHGIGLNIGYKIPFH